MTIVQESSENGLVLKVSGRVDTTTAADLQKAMLNAFAQSSNLVMDFTEVDYVSSAGLRVFLMAQKTASSKGGSFALSNVSEAVITILKTVGFYDMLTII